MSDKTQTAQAPRNFSHPVKAPAVSLVWENGRSCDRSVLHAKGCTHTRSRHSRGIEYQLAMEEFDLTTVLADDYFDVAPCARKA